MRHSLLFLAILLLPAAPALAQVTVDLRALDALPHSPGPPVHRPTARAPASQPSATAAKQPAGSAKAAAAQPPTTTAQPSTTTAEATAPTAPAPAPSGAPAPPTAPSQPAPPPATIAAAPPPVATIPPVEPPVPPANAAPPAPPPIAANAGTTAAATAAGLRLTFSKDQSDLSPGSVTSIKQFVQSAPHTDSITYNVLAYSTGDPDDPSVARRMSLSRAIAVRSALMADGVSSSRIYLRALGSEKGDGGPPDRVEINVLGGNANAAAAQR
jgi:outer membrane protein OmpA-like peptidoglycan-associated protein